MGNTAIVLAGGSGSRMKTKVKKQYLMLGNYPVLWYSLRTFEACSRIDEIVLVCGKGEKDTCTRQFVQEYGFTKIQTVVEGGKERWNSVQEGLKAAQGCRNVLIHDGARPFIEEEMVNRILDTLEDCPACVVGMPVKETIKVCGPDGCVERTLPREKLWTIQTPQAFSYPLIRKAYDALAGQGTQGVTVTDDAMVAELMLGTPVRLIEGSYQNIKITTPEDLPVARALAEDLFPGISPFHISK